MDKKKLKIRTLKALVYLLELLAVGLIVYLLLLPFYPALKYKVVYEKWGQLEQAKDKAAVEEYVGQLPVAADAVQGNRLIIPKIGVLAPIIESRSADYGLSKGAWRVPETSTPDKGGNTVITGHRFKYLPPHNLTFYLFHKLEKGDVFTIIWNDQEYYYRIREVKIVDDTDLSVLDPSDTPIVTMFTCHPIYSTEQRLVVIGELIDDVTE